MENSFKTTTISFVYDQFTEAYNWVLSLGLVRPGSRFEKYKEYFSALDAAYRAGSLAQVLNDNNAHLYSSILNDSLELYQIYQGLKTLEIEVYRDKIEEYTSGPVFPSDENSSSSNRARNTGFELTMLSLFLRSGYTDIQRSDADASIVINGLTYFIECKRPQSQAKVEENIKKSLSQLKKRIAEKFHRNRRAIFSISMNKIINPSNGLLQVNSIQELESRFKRLSEWFEKKHEHRWHKIMDQRLVAGIMHINSVVLVTEQNMLTTAEWALMLSINNTGTSDAAEILSIGTAMTETIKP